MSQSKQFAVIFQPANSAMQSAPTTAKWKLEFTSTSPNTHDPLMGWIGSDDTQKQVSLEFPTKESAIAYAETNKISYRVELPQTRRIKPKSYADNFC